MRPARHDEVPPPNASVRPRVACSRLQRLSSAIQLAGLPFLAMQTFSVQLELRKPKFFDSLAGHFKAPSIDTEQAESPARADRPTDPPDPNESRRIRHHANAAKDFRWGSRGSPSPSPPQSHDAHAAENVCGHADVQRRALRRFGDRQYSRADVLGLRIHHRQRRLDGPVAGNRAELRAKGPSNSCSQSAEHPHRRRPKRRPVAGPRRVHCPHGRR